MINNIYWLKLRPKHFTTSDFALVLSNLGTPNFFSKNSYKFTSNKISWVNYFPMAPVYVPHPSILFNSIFYFRLKNKFIFNKKSFFNKRNPNFISKVPTYIQIEHFSMIKITANLLCILAKKKLEKEHMVVEILWNFTLLTAKSSAITGFMFLLKGRFSWKERASKIFMQRGALQNTNLWANLDYCEVPVHLKYGTASIWIWLVTTDKYDETSYIA